MLKGSLKYLQFADLNLAVAYGAVKHYGFLSSAVILSWSAIRVPTVLLLMQAEVTLIDPANGVNRESSVDMNHILDYGGYRFSIFF